MSKSERTEMIRKRGENEFANRIRTRIEVDVSGADGENEHTETYNSEGDRIFMALMRDVPENDSTNVTFSAIGGFTIDHIAHIIDSMRNTFGKNKFDLALTLAVMMSAMKDKINETDD